MDLRGRGGEATKGDATTDEDVRRGDDRRGREARRQSTRTRGEAVAVAAVPAMEREGRVLPADAGDCADQSDADSVTACVRAVRA
jgi:hypothetical protein